MTTITGITRGGAPWTPTFVVALNQEKCIGCGRCYKVCPRNVFELIEYEADEEQEDERDEFDDDNTMVMTITNPMDCIGCGACGRVCPKGCHTHESASLAA